MVVSLVLLASVTVAGAHPRAARVPVRTRVARFLAKPVVRVLGRSALFLTGATALVDGVVRGDTASGFLGANFMITALARDRVLVDSVTLGAAGSFLGALSAFPPPEPILDLALPITFTLWNGAEVLADHDRAERGR